MNISEYQIRKRLSFATRQGAIFLMSGPIIENRSILDIPKDCVACARVSLEKDPTDPDYVRARVLAESQHGGYLHSIRFSNGSVHHAYAPKHVYPRLTSSFHASAIAQLDIIYTNPNAPLTQTGATADTVLDFGIPVRPRSWVHNVAPSANLAHVTYEADGTATSANIAININHTKLEPISSNMYSKFAINTNSGSKATGNMYSYLYVDETTIQADQVTHALFVYSSLDGGSNNSRNWNEDIVFLLDPSEYSFDQVQNDGKARLLNIRSIRIKVS